MRFAKPLCLIAKKRRQENCCLKTTEHLITASQHNAGWWESAHVTPLVQINNSSAPALCRLAVYTFVELLACLCLLFSLGTRGPYEVLWRMKGKKDFDKRNFKGQLDVSKSRVSLAHLELRVGIRHTGVRLKVKSKTSQFLVFKTVVTKLSLLPWKVLEPILLQMGEGRLLSFIF